MGCRRVPLAELCFNVRDSRSIIQVNPVISSSFKEEKDTMYETLLLIRSKFTEEKFSRLCFKQISFCFLQLLDDEREVLA